MKDGVYLDRFGELLEIVTEMGVVILTREDRLAVYYCYRIPLNVLEYLESLEYLGEL